MDLLLEDHDVLGHGRLALAELGYRCLDGQDVALEIPVDLVLLDRLDVQHPLLLLAQAGADVRDLLLLVAHVPVVGLVALQRLVPFDLETREPILEGLDGRVGPVFLRVGDVRRRAPELRVHLGQLALGAADLLPMDPERLLGVLQVLVQDVDLLVDVHHLGPPEVRPKPVLGPLHLGLEDVQLSGVEGVDALVGIRAVVMLDVDVGQRVHQARRAIRISPEVADLEHVGPRRRRDRQRQLHLADHLAHARAGLGRDADADHGLLEDLAAPHDLGLARDHVRVEGHVDAPGGSLGGRELHRLADLHQDLGRSAPGARPQQRHRGRDEEDQQEDADHQAAVLEDRVEKAARGEHRSAGTGRRKQRRGLGKGLERCHVRPATAASTPRPPAAAPGSARARTRRRHRPCRRSRSAARTRRRSDAVARVRARRG